ncbi:MAG: hypothetical protein AAF799_25505 [Myxococcota bacterium]
MTFIPNLRPTTLLLLLPFAAGCPMDDDTSEDGGVLQSFSILGTVGRAEAAVPSGDGVGTVWIAALSACELGAPLAGATSVPNADLSSAESIVEFEIPDLPPGQVHLALFLDDDLDADPMMPIPGPGDLVYADVAGDGILSCVAIDVDDEDVEDVALLLTAVAPGA